MKTSLLLAGLLAVTLALAGLAPATAATPTAARPAPAPQAHPPLGAAPARVDINSADLATLQTLPGVTQEVARRIVAGRPYLSKSHLLARKVVSDEVYEAIRRDVVAVQKAKGTKGKARPAKPSQAPKPSPAASPP